MFVPLTRMGFVVLTFQGLDYAVYTNMYVSIQSFSINRINGKWTCRFFLQAHRSREDKQNGFPGFFLSYWVQTAEIEIVDLSKILEEIYRKAKTLYGDDDNCIDVIEDSTSEVVTAFATA
jgi:hypothetical protein